MKDVTQYNAANHSHNKHTHKLNENYKNNEIIIRLEM